MPNQVNVFASVYLRLMTTVCPPINWPLIRSYRDLCAEASDRIGGGLRSPGVSRIHLGWAKLQVVGKIRWQGAQSIPSLDSPPATRVGVILFAG